jgi:hypothetical protein
MRYLHTLSTKRATERGRKPGPADSELAKKLIVSFETNLALPNRYRAKNSKFPKVDEEQWLYISQNN